MVLIKHATNIQYKHVDKIKMRRMTNLVINLTSS